MARTAPAAARLLWLRSRRLPALVVALLVGVLTLMAFRYEGLPTAEVDVNDGGIWVTKGQTQQVGHLNYEARVLDAGFKANSSQFDIAQFEDTITFSDLAVNSIIPVDPAAVRLGAATSLADRTTAVQGGKRLGILDAAEGNLWVADARNPSGVTYTEGTALATDLEGGVVTAGLDGTVLAVSPTSSKFTVVSAKGLADAITNTPIQGLSPTAQLTLTAVGSRPVALDARTNTLILPDGSQHSLTEAGVAPGGMLQQPGPATDHVLLATANSLVSVKLDGFAVTQVPAATDDQTPGLPAAPVRLEGCEYAAWAGSGRYLRQCDGSSDIVRQGVDSLARAGTVAFRTNRKLIVLNDIGSGSVWLPEKNMFLVDGWDQVESKLNPKEKEEESPQNREEITDPERKDKNTPPVADDDEFGVRPGRSTTLDVLGNDSDRDGDVLTARPLSKPDFGTVWRTRGSQALRIDVPSDATGSTTFTYEASDGRAVDSASARVTVHPWSVNEGPVQRRDPGIKIGHNAEIEYNVLPDWRDPDGDLIYLQSVKGPDNIQVQFRQEGTITVKDLGAKPGTVLLDVEVSDGQQTTKGHLTLQVQRPGNLPPTANGDFYVARANEVTTVQPLANDTDPNNDTLTLLGLSAAPQGSSLVPDLDLGTFAFRANAPGTYYVSYTVTDGPSTTFGVVRIDVVASDQSSAPVAEDDLVLLPRDGAALAAPLNNDTDPSGGVLVLQSVDTQDLKLKVTLVDHHLLRITSPVELTEPVTFTYTVSNGAHVAKAKIFVVPVKAQDTKRPPEVQNDRARVRVGDIASVPVLANDSSPAGLALRVDPDLSYTPNPEVGTPFVTGNQVRLEAGPKPGFMHVGYTVRDASGNMASAQVLFEVVALDSANAAPRPKVLTAWAVAGQTTRIPVPMAGIDPDGDSVTLVGIEQPPQRGTALLGVDWLEYTPAPGAAGTDVFTYIVEDRQGKQASASVRVGIAPPSATNQEPSAVPDILRVRPDRLLTVPVLDNDIDPDGDRLALLPDSLTAKDPRLQPTIVGTSIAVRTPPENGSYLVTYKVGDGRGGTDSGVLTLNVTDVAPLLPPLARDDIIPISEVPTDGSPARVEVLTNDEDPDGDFAKLKVSTKSTGVSVQGNTLLIKPEPTRRLVVYTITDEDGLTGSALVSVPGTQRFRPHLDETKLPLKIRAGQELTIDLSNYVLTREGRTPRLTDVDKVKASVGSDGPPKVQGDKVIVFKAQADYAGDSGVSFEVSDGTPEDRSALAASLTIPIKVIASINHPPVFTPNTIRVGPDEPVVTDLAEMVTDPDGVDPRTFSYTIVRQLPGVPSSIQNGHLLSTRVLARDHRKGEAGSIEVSVNDGSGETGKPIGVVVVASTRDPIQIGAALIDDANAGQTRRVDVADYATNPYPDTPLRIVTTSLGNKSDGTVDPQGTHLNITPRTDFHGQMIVNYRLADATNDPDRFRDGVVRLIVRARPEPPSNVEVSPTGATSAMVSFTPGADNGAPIDYFTITDETTGKKYRCTAASCPVIGLNPPGQKHAFSVVATNAAGTSDPSPTSAPVLIDKRPGKPNPPTVTPEDQAINVDWKAPVNEGSDITGYTLFVSGSNKKYTTGGDQTSMRITGLVNGQSYRVSVQAVNNAEEPSDVSEPSSAAVPFGAPPGPKSVKYANLPSDDPSVARVEISWSYPGDSNGRPWDLVRLEPASGTTKTVDSDGSVTSAVLEVAPAESSSVKVSLHTEGGWSPAESVSFQAVSVPVAIPEPTVKPTGKDGELVVSGAATVAGNGYRKSQLSLQYSTGGSWQALDSMTLTGLTNGDPVTVSFRQVSTAFGAPSYGPAVKVAPATPYGPPIKPTLSAQPRPGAVDFSWQAKADNGGPKVTQLYLTVNGTKRVTTTDLSGTATITANSGSLLKATMTACDSEGTCTTSDTVEASPWGSVEVAPAGCNGGEVPGIPTDTSPPPTCYTFSVRAVDWNPRVSLTCAFKSDIDSQTRTFGVGASGWSESDMRTNVTDKNTMAGWVANGTLTCKP